MTEGLQIKVACSFQEQVTAIGSISYNQEHQKEMEPWNSSE